jgi:hypothetical protein
MVYMATHQNQHVLVLVLALRSWAFVFALVFGFASMKEKRNGHLICTIHFPIAGDGLDQHVVAHESEDGNDGLVDQRKVGQLWKVAFHDKLVTFLKRQC